MSLMQTRPIDESIARLRAELTGRVIDPGALDYDALRGLVYGGFDERPAAIARVADARDVARVVTFARETGLELAVRGGGHSPAGHSTTDGGIVLDLRDMKGLDIDVEGRTAWAEAGLTTGEVTGALAEHGLVVGFGDTGTVGIGGITLGGGVGFLVRALGLTIDALLAVELVTADGEIRQVDATSEPDLFWAVRGGGGNVGVVTRFRYRLHELPQVVGGILVLPATAETIAGFVAAAEAAPDELSTIANVMPAPPMPFLPEDVHGQLVILGLLCHAGPAEAGQAAIAPFRALAEPLADMIRPMPYPDMFMPDDPDYHPTAVARTMFLDRVDAGVGDSRSDAMACSEREATRGVGSPRTQTRARRCGPRPSDTGSMATMSSERAKRP
jgi:FAD/FMN-containing dehydrogenase